MATLKIDPPLLNSAGPWATTSAELEDLYHCNSTGAITTRTCTLNGFAHDDSIHQYSFFDPSRFKQASDSERQAGAGSINTLGYSPLPLSQTLQILEKITKAVNHPSATPKPIIISITGSVEELKACMDQIAQAKHSICAPLYVEINLSCPNILGKPPPAFSAEGLIEYLTCIRDFNSLRDKLEQDHPTASTLLFGIKVPPYSNPENFQLMKQALLKFVTNDIPELPVQFITATNTLGCSLVLDKNCVPLVSSEDGSGIGGMAGAPLHALSLGNVHIIRSILKSHEALQHVQVIGVGGVNDREGMRRMKSAGADFVAVGTAVALSGVKVFDEILSN